MWNSTNRSTKTSRRPILSLERLEDRATPAVFAGEFRANTTVAMNQLESSSASSLKGHVLVWTSRDSFDKAEIYAQRYSASRAKVGSEIRVTNSAAFDFNPRACMDDAGNFTIVWTASVSTTNQDVLMARYNAAGLRLGAIRNVAASSAKEFSPSIACSAGGEVIVSYTAQVTSANFNIIARQYSNSGALVKSITVAATAAKEQTSQVARSRGSNAVFDIVYRSGNDVRLKRYTSNGTALGTPIVVAKAPSGRIEMSPSIGIANDGNAVVAWRESGNTDGAITGSIYARKVSSTGVLGAVISVAKGSHSYTPDEIGLGYSSTFTYSSPQIIVSPTTKSFGIIFQGDSFTMNSDIDFQQESKLYFDEFNAAGKPVRTTTVSEYFAGGGVNTLRMYPSASVNAAGVFVLNYTNEDPDSYNDREDIYLRWGKLS